MENLSGNREWVRRLLGLDPLSFSARRPCAVARLTLLVRIGLLLQYW